jgi:hypothetical protein
MQECQRCPLSEAASEAASQLREKCPENEMAELQEKVCAGVIDQREAA